MGEARNLILDLLDEGAEPGEGDLALVEQRHGPLLLKSDSS